MPLLVPPKKKKRKENFFGKFRIDLFPGKTNFCYGYLRRKLADNQNWTAKCSVILLQIPGFQYHLQPCWFNQRQTALWQKSTPAASFPGKQMVLYTVLCTHLCPSAPYSILIKPEKELSQGQVESNNSKHTELSIKFYKKQELLMLDTAETQLPPGSGPASCWASTLGAAARPSEHSYFSKLFHKVCIWESLFSSLLPSISLKKKKSVH